MNMLTRERILAMPAGREMDAWVAERVLDWKRRTGSIFSNESEWEPPNSVGWDWLPESSTDIAAAWLVVEKLGLLNRWTLSSSDEPKYFMTLGYEDAPAETIIADSAPLAICRAALLTTLAVEVK